MGSGSGERKVSVPGYYYAGWSCAGIIEKAVEANRKKSERIQLEETLFLKNMKLLQDD